MAEEVIKIRLENEGSCPTGGESGGAPNGGAARVARTGGNYAAPAWSNVSRGYQHAARESIIAKEASRLPFISRDQGARFAFGVRAGLAVPDVARASKIGYQSAGVAGGLGGRVGAVAGQAASALGMAAPTVAGLGIGLAGASMGAAAGLAAVSAAAGGLVLAFNLQQRSMERWLGTFQGSGALQGLQARESVRLTVDRELRALRAYPELSDMLSRQTTRQMSFDRAVEKIQLAIAQSMEPLAESAADLAEVIALFSVDDIRSAISDVGDVAKGLQFLASPGAAIVWEWLLSKARKAMGDIGMLADIARAFEYKQQTSSWNMALDPFSEKNAPFDVSEDPEMASFYNPKRVS